MGFGKRAAGWEPAAAPAAAEARPAQAAAALVTAPKAAGIDAQFLAIVLGVVALAGGAAFFLPNILGPSKPKFVVLPISQAVAGLDREHAKAVLADQAFPDAAGRSFMASLAPFPKDRDELLGELADAAAKGADRNDLVDALNDWTVSFAHANFSAIARTGAKGFDRSMDISDAELSYLKTNGGCSLSGLRTLVNDPVSGAALADYGTTGYKISMQSNQAMVELAAQGRNAPYVESVLRQKDGKAVLDAFSSLMKDPKALGVIQSMTQSAGAPQPGNGRKSRAKKAPVASKLAPDEVDFCELGKTIIGKMRGLPDDTKARMWAMSMSRAAMQDIVARR